MISLERRIWLWALIGPLLVLMSLSICACRAGNLALPLFGVVACGLPASFILRWRGLIFSSILLFLIPLVGLLLGHSFPPWMAGLTLAMGVGFSLTVVGRDELFLLLRTRFGVEDRVVVELDSHWKGVEEGWREREEQLIRRVAELEEQFELTDGERRQERQLRQLAQGNIERLERDRIQDTQRLHLALRESENLMTVEEEISSLRQELNELRVSHFQQRLDLARPLAIERDEEGVEELARRLRMAGQAILALRSYRDRYLQLRSQFAEKSALLDETRRALFLLEEREEVRKREKEEEELPLYSLAEAELEELVGALLKELESRSCLSLGQNFTPFRGD